MPELNSATSDVSTGSEATSTPAETQAPAASDSSSQETTELEVVHDGAPVDIPMYDEVSDDTQGAEATEDQSKEEAADNSKDEADETKSKDQPREEKKRGENARVRDLVAREKVYKDIIKGLNPDYDVDAAIRNGVLPADARLDAMEHDHARDSLSRNIAELNTDYQQQADELSDKYPYMDGSREDRTEAEVKAANDMMDLWFQAANPVFVAGKDGKPVMDGSGNLLLQSSNVPLFDFVDKIETHIAERVATATTEAENRGQINAERKLSAVEVPTTPRAPSTDRSNDASLSAADYAAKHGLKVT